MSKKLLIISATSRNNLELAQQIDNITSSLNIEKDLINLEEYDIPLYTTIKQEDTIPKHVNDITLKFIDASGFIFCAPEYNAGIPPILTNAITWISVSTKNWRDVFKNKKALIASHSGSGAHAFLSSFQAQLEYMGCTVYHRKISVHRNAEFNPESVDRILSNFKTFFK